MRPLFIAIITVALVTAAHAQGMHGGGKKSRGGGGPSAPTQKKVDDKDYKAALERLPDQKYDPWKGVR